MFSNLLRRHIVVHLDVSKIDADTKRELFTSTRENLRKSLVLDQIVERLSQILAEDSRLYELERELQERIFAATDEDTSYEVKEQVIRMLQEAGLPVGTQKRRRPRWTASGAHGNGGAREKLPPLETKPFAEVSYLKIAAPVSPTNAYLCETKTIRIETDASSSFDEFGFLSLECNPPLLEVTHKSPLADGRASWRLTPTSKAFPGMKGEISVVLSVPMPDGPVEKFRSTVQFEIYPARGALTDDIEVPDIEILPIDPREERTHELWRSLWPDIEPADPKAGSVAFKLLRNGILKVYYNVGFDAYRKGVKKFGEKNAELLRQFDSEYRIYAAFHAVMQSSLTRDVLIDSDVLESITEQERAVTAALIARHAESVVQFRKSQLTLAGEQAELPSVKREEAAH